MPVIEVPCRRITLCTNIRSGRTNQTDMRIYFMDRFFKRFITRKEVRFLCLPLLITDSKQLQSEWFRMAKPCTDFSPSGVRRVIGKRNQIQRILHKCLETAVIQINPLI